MSGWQRVIARVASNVEDRFDRMRHRLSTRLGSDEVHIVPYRGYGTARRLHVRGRVLEDPGLRSSEENATVWANLTNMYRRFESDEVRGATVNVQFDGQTHTAVTDEEGFLDLWIDLDSPPPADRLWHQVRLELADTAPEEETVAAAANVLVPPASAAYGVISDIDDTIVRTDATSLLRMARNVFLGNAYTRLPFPGVSAFYQALQAGAGGREQNPIFYVSSSPWNLYDLLHDFMDLQAIPIGPIMLRDWGLTETELLPTGHEGHKLSAVGQILDLYPDMPFVLVGDSGQEDPEIYHRVVHDYPERIKAVYIRDVTAGVDRRTQAVNELAEAVADAGSDLLLVADSLTAARHAAANGLISTQALDEIQSDVDADRAPAVEGLDIVEER